MDTNFSLPRAGQCRMGFLAIDGRSHFFNLSVTSRTRRRRPDAV
jgi:hypothetical protein